MLFIDNLNKIKQKFIWEAPLTQMFCAAAFSSVGKSADTGAMIRERKLLMQNGAHLTSGWGTFSAAASAIIAAGDHEAGIRAIPHTYLLLKQNIPDSAYLPLAACILTMAGGTEGKTARLCERTAFLYSRTAASHNELLSAAFGAITAEAEGITDEKLYSRYMAANYLLADLPQSMDFAHRTAISICAGTDDITEKCRVIRSVCEKFPGEEIPVCLFTLRAEEIPAACERFHEILTVEYAGENARPCAAYMVLSEYGRPSPLLFLMEMPDSASEGFRAS